MKLDKAYKILEENKQTYNEIADEFNQTRNKHDSLMDDLKGYIKNDEKILDLGCAPGSWAQYTSKIVGPNGFIFGIDLKPVSVSAKNAKFVVGDIFNTPIESFEGSPFDVIMSDMAPNTTGVVLRDQMASAELCQKVIEIIPGLIKPNGSAVMKIFMSNEVKSVEKLLKTMFKQVHYVRPQSVRKVSYEIFLVGLGYSK
ncbi:MAG: RlmE family RNA methyltransferase [Candidatus Portnoybacteria bacterium]|nr:RlmE family RNA methyltransferase [Candidatus Portnoybacteria bacterium]